MEKSDGLPIWIELLITISVTAGIYGLIFLPGKLGRLFTGKPVQPETTILTVGRVHPKLAILMLGILAVVFFGGVEILSIAVRNGTDTWWTHVGFTLAAGSGFYLITSYFRACVEYGESGARYQSTFGFRGSVTWLEIRRVRFSRLRERLTFENRTGEKMRVSVSFVNGITEFAELVLEQVSPSAFDNNTQTALALLAEGKSAIAGRQSSQRPLLVRFAIYLTHQLRKVIAYRRGG